MMFVVSEAKYSQMQLLNYIPCIFLLLSCTGNKADAGIEVNDPAKIPADSIARPAGSNTGPGNYYLWEVNAAKKTLRKHPFLTAATANIDSMINSLNRRYKNILERGTIKTDTLQLKAADANIPASQVEQWLAETVINLASIRGVRYVQLDFKKAGGDSSAIFSRNDFPGYITIQ